MACVPHKKCDSIVESLNKLDLLHCSTVQLEFEREEEGEDGGDGD